MGVAPRVSFVTLGVDDVARSTGFYQALGWPLSPASFRGETHDHERDDPRRDDERVETEQDAHVGEYRSCTGWAKPRRVVVRRGPSGM